MQAENIKEECFIPAAIRQHIFTIAISAGNATMTTKIFVNESQFV